MYYSSQTKPRKTKTRPTREATQKNEKRLSNAGNCSGLPLHFPISGTQEKEKQPGVLTWEGARAKRLKSLAQLKNSAHYPYKDQSLSGFAGFVGVYSPLSKLRTSAGERKQRRQSPLSPYSIRAKAG